MSPCEAHATRIQFAAELQSRGPLVLSQRVESHDAVDAVVAGAGHLDRRVVHVRAVGVLHGVADHVSAGYDLVLRPCDIQRVQGLHVVRMRGVPVDDHLRLGHDVERVGRRIDHRSAGDADHRHDVVRGASAAGPP